MMTLKMTNTTGEVVRKENQFSSSGIKMAKKKNKKSKVAKNRAKKISRNKAKKKARSLIRQKAQSVKEEKFQIPPELQDRYKDIRMYIEVTCKTDINAEYAIISEQLLRYIMEKKPSMLAKGQPNSWAAGIVHAVGKANLLFDKMTDPYISAKDLADSFMVSPSTASSKSKIISKEFDIEPYDSRWCTLENENFVTESLKMQEMLEGMLEQGVSPYYVDEEIYFDDDDFDDDFYDEDFDDEDLDDKDVNDLINEMVDILSDHISELKAKNPNKGQKACGLCGNTKKLTKTDCCDNWICDDMDQYVMFSYERNSCYRNHSQYTLCASHHHNNHSGKWQECKKCKKDFPTEMYVWHGTNEYNFEVLKNPPKFKPTRCSRCNSIISLTEDSYSLKGGKYVCMRCSSIF